MTLRYAAAALLFAPAAAFAGEAENKANALRLMEERLEQGRFEIGAELYDPSFVLRGVNRDYNFEEAEQSARDVRAAFPDLKIDVEHAVAEGDFVALHWTGSGVNSVKIGMFPGLGRPVTIKGMVFFRFRNGKIVEEWALHDNLSLMQQLGAEPAP
jgi:predicted ester cyclase